MRAYYDLHMHSVLSPCAERDMTPNNMVNMAVLKELDFIAITDHNGIANVAAAQAVAKDLPIEVIGGIEVQTKEDVHVVCLFKNLNDLSAFYDEIYSHIIPLEHNAKRFGEQSVMNDQDEIIGTIKQSLYASIQLSVEKIVELALAYGGAAFPAHVDRQSFSIIANLGFVPPDLPVKAIEISTQTDVDSFLAQHKYLKKYRILRNSDAHELYKISEPINYVELTEKTIDCFFETMFGV